MPGTGTAGFGAGPREEGVVVNPADIEQYQHPEISIAKNIQEIHDRYVLPPGLFSAQVNLTQNSMVKVDLSQRDFNALLITVNSGILFGWFGDFTSANGQAQTFSHFAISAGIVPGSQVIPMPPGRYVITLQANGGAATGYLTAMAL